MAEIDAPSTSLDPTTELTTGIAETARALFSAGSVGDTLQQVVDLAVESIDGCDFAGVFLLEGDLITTPVHTHPVVIEIDALQHRCGEGPCIAAITHGTTYYAEELGDDARWPAFGPQATALGVRSALAVSLSDDGSLGALNLYARCPQAFGVICRAKGGAPGRPGRIGALLGRSPRRRGSSARQPPGRPGDPGGDRLGPGDPHGRSSMAHLR